MKLKPPRNRRIIEPRVCANCKHYRSENGSWWCERDPEYLDDVGDGWQNSTTCDRFNRWTVRRDGSKEASANKLLR